MQARTSRASWFQRFLLPGFAFKAVVIGGGYATGRELAEFFVPSGPLAGLLSMLLVMLLWSLVCAATFAIAVAAGTFDYRSFFQVLLGRWWFLFEIAYMLFVVLILAVYGAAAGAIGHELIGWPSIVGTMMLATAIISFATFGNNSVESLFKWVSVLLYCVYAVFLILALTRFGPAIESNIARPALSSRWLSGGIAYASYNVVGAVAILPMLRHLTRRRDAILAGLAAGPLAMLPAIAFFVAMIGFYPGIASATLPSAVILSALELPIFHITFQLMIFCALIESGTGSIHAINERIANAWQRRHKTELPTPARAAVATAVLTFCVFVAGRFGLVALIADGYRVLALAILAVYIVPLSVTVCAVVSELRRIRGDATPSDRTS